MLAARCKTSPPSRPNAGAFAVSRHRTEHRYEKLTWPEINDAVDDGQVVIVPCGAVEQHGPHLPLDVDLVCPCGIAAGAGREIPDTPAT
jgi:creatinine amidohydrolase